MNTPTNSFYIAANENGSFTRNLPLWASSKENPLALTESASQAITRVDVDGVPGAFKLLNVLSHEECLAFIRAAESLGYHEDAAVSLGRHIRHNMNLNWIIDSVTERRIWSRVAPFFNVNDTFYLGKKPLSLNQRFRFYRYEKGDFFGVHTDGAWPGSQIISNKPIADAFGDRYSLYTFLIFLNDDFIGGETQFFLDENDVTKPARSAQTALIHGVRTPIGGVLCFPHGSHPLHCLHASQEISQGAKYIIRTDVLFSL